MTKYFQGLSKFCLLYNKLCILYSIYWLGMDTFRHFHWWRRTCAAYTTPPLAWPAHRRKPENTSPPLNPFQIQNLGTASSHCTRWWRAAPAPHWGVSRPRNSGRCAGPGIRRHPARAADATKSNGGSGAHVERPRTASCPGGGAGRRLAPCRTDPGLAGEPATGRNGWPGSTEVPVGNTARATRSAIAVPFWWRSSPLQSQSWTKLQRNRWN